MTQLEQLELFGYFSNRSEREMVLTNKYIDEKVADAIKSNGIKPLLSEVLAKMIEKGRKQNGSSILEIEIDTVKSILSEYFA